MITWATEYGLLCIAALLIGVATAAWIWLRPRPPVDDSLDIDGPSARISAPPPPAAPLEPVKPVIDVAQPMAFAPLTAENTGADGAPPPAAGRPSIAPAIGDADDLTLLKGVGPKLNALLGTLGVTRFDQIAAWTDADIAEVDGFLGNFKGRATRDHWVEQAG
ncbi:MAG: hypothetical protein ACKOUM_01700, partial [Sphingopyxis sp.]